MFFWAGLFIPIFLSQQIKAAEKEIARGEVVIITSAAQLPREVRRMHEAIARAAMSGKIDNMREVLQLSELMPLVNGQFIHDPVKHWKAASKDKSGRELLAILTEILELPVARKTTAKGVSYIWPYFSAVPLDKLSPSEIVRLYRLDSAAKIAAMLEHNRYGQAVVILGDDGTWHSFEHPGFGE